MKLVKYFLIAFILPLSQTHAQKILSSRALTSSAQQHTRADFTITTSGNFVNPFDLREVMVDMVIKTPSGKALVLPCYFAGSANKVNEWNARFTPQENGTYQYHFRVTTKEKKVVSETKPVKLQVAPSKKDGMLHIYDYWTLRFDSGKPFRGIGENVGWEGRSFEDKKWTYDHLLPTLSKNGANFFRTWMCQWNLPLAWKNVNDTDRYQKSDSYFNEGGIKRMDELVEMSDSLGLHFMLSIDAHGALIKGSGWKFNDHNKANGGPAATPEEFFTHPESKAMYKNRLRYLIARWGYSPAIAAWEFFNEIDNAVFTPTPHDSVLIDHTIITAWHDEMSTFIRKNDPYKHIITTSISHRDIDGMNDLKNMELNQKHIYNKTHQIPGTIVEYVDRHKKPYVIGEYGYDWNWDNVKHEYGPNFDFDFKRGLWYGLFSPTPILPMTWWWEYFDERNMKFFYKNVKTINDMMLTAGSGSFESIKLESKAFETMAVKCGSSYFVYVLNNGNARAGEQITLGVSDNGIFRVQRFNTSEGIFADDRAVKSVDGKLIFNTGDFNVHEDRIYILNVDPTLDRSPQ